MFGVNKDLREKVEIVLDKYSNSNTAEDKRKYGHELIILLRNGLEEINGNTTEDMYEDKEDFANLLELAERVKNDEV